MNIDDALNAERPDMAVAEWLQDKMWSGKVDPLPAEVDHSVQVDYFLSQVMMGGIDQAVENCGADMPRIIEGFRAMGLHDHVSWIRGVVDGNSDSNAADQGFLETAGMVEKTNHSYIRAHLSKFQSIE